MIILWITSLHLLKIFDCNYNTEIKVPFFGDDLLVSHDLVPDAIILTAQLSSELPHSLLWVKLS